MKIKIIIIIATLLICSCTAGITVGRANKIEQSVTNSADSANLRSTFSLTPNK